MVSIFFADQSNRCADIEVARGEVATSFDLDCRSVFSRSQFVCQLSAVALFTGAVYFVLFIDTKLTTPTVAACAFQVVGDHAILFDDNLGHSWFRVRISTFGQLVWSQGLRLEGEVWGVP